LLSKRCTGRRETANIVVADVGRGGRVGRCHVSISDALRAKLRLSCNYRFFQSVETNKCARCSRVTISLRVHNISTLNTVSRPNTTIQMRMSAVCIAEEHAQFCFKSCEYNGVPSAQHTMRPQYQRIPQQCPHRCSPNCRLPMHNQLSSRLRYKAMAPSPTQSTTHQRAHLWSVQPHSSRMSLQSDPIFQ
jgi:hypothetical protein